MQYHFPVVCLRKMYAKLHSTKSEGFVRYTRSVRENIPICAISLSENERTLFICEQQKVFLASKPRKIMC